MSSECDFWSRAMGSGCDVITAIRGGLRRLQISLVGASRHEKEAAINRVVGSGEEAEGLRCARRELWGRRALRQLCRNGLSGRVCRVV